MNIPGYKRMPRSVEKDFNAANETPGQWWFRIDSLGIYARFDPGTRRWFLPKDFCP